MNLAFEALRAFEELGKARQMCGVASGKAACK